MRWGDIDLTKGTWSKPPSSTKQAQHHEVPLSAPARALLARIREEQAAPKRPLGEFVFPSTSASGHLVEIKKSWAMLAKAAGIKNLRLHDLRHSYASALVSSGASLPLIGSLLGHASPQTTARYSHMFADPQRAAAEKIGVLIENAAQDSPPDNLVTLKGRS
jgi:integrase